MSEDMESKGIYFDLQWKTKSGGSNAEEFGSIGIWEVDDSSLDWFTFKPYLCQTLGNLENVSISYIDSDGDEIPIDSDLEFQEALKFARKKAATRQKIVLKVEKLDNPSSSAGTTELLSNPMYLKSSNFFKERLKISCNNDEQDLLHASSGEGPIRISNSFCKLKTKSKSKDVLFCPLQSCDSPPLWFKKYMKKMKSEIISEVTANVNSQVKKLLEDIGQKARPVYFPSTSVNSYGNQGVSGKSGAWLVAKARKKTMVFDGDSSDGAPRIDIKDSKILKKIEKLDRRERKLDHKKEKLEQKTRKIAERKEREYLSKLRLERAGCKASQIESRSYKKLREPELVTITRQKVSASKPAESIVPPLDLEEGPVGVSVNGDDMRMMTVKRGSSFTKVWKVINSGGTKWDDETEVKLAWGNAGLNPESFSVKCPPLAPGEEGEITINFTSPNFPGVFESHWHFYQQNVRFGGRLSCIVSVDLIKREEESTTESRRESLSPSSSAEFIVLPSTSVGVNVSGSETRDENLQKDSAVINEALPVSSASNTETQEELNLLSSASGPWAKEPKFVCEEKCSCTGEKEEELDSLSTDDLSGSDNSLGSDSDDNFVVVPMPPCFRIDVPLNSAGPSGVEMNEEETPKQVVDTDNPTVSDIPESPSREPSAPLDVDVAQAADYSQLNEIPLQREVSHDTGEVISVPLIKVQPRPIGSTPQFQPAVTPLSPKRQSTEPRVVILNKSEKSSPSSPVNTPRVSSTMSPDRSCDSDHSYAKSSPGRSAPAWSPEYTGSRGSDSKGAEKSTNTPRVSPTPSSQNSSRPIDLKPRVVTEVTPGTVYNEPPRSSPQRPKKTNSEDPPPPPIDPVMANELTQLVNMGFMDLELNQALLRVYNHNLPQVIEALLNGRP